LARPKGIIRVDREVCKGCSLCVAACPFEIIALDRENHNRMGYHPALLIDEERCTGCTLCALVCPDVCIKVFREKAVVKKG
jgi:2-oxoglutarate ferredoxin oxidoreductase subunit delta